MPSNAGIFLNMDRDVLLNIISEVVQHIIHEYNNKLTPIEGNLSIIKEKVVEQSIIDDIKDIEDVVLAMRRYRDDLRIFYSKDAINLEVFDLNKIIEKVIQSYSKKLNITFEKSQCANIKANLCEIEYLLNELLINTYLHCGKNTEVLIKTLNYEGKVYMIYQDSGKGVEDTVKIFIPFYTTDASRKGLGLSNIWGITRRNSIKMDVVSEYGKYIRFEFKFNL